VNNRAAQVFANGGKSGPPSMAADIATQTPMTRICRNCQGADIRQTELSFDAARTDAWQTTWSFDMRVCANCGLVEYFLPKRDLGWARKKLPPMRGAGG
jgi:hypothetical protein